VTLEQLRIFVAVAERQHVTRAAEALNLAQSAASAAIASLESRHRTKLFDRVGRNIELTEQGRAFLDEARAVLARVAAAELMLAEFGGLRRGSLSVCASQTIAGYWVPRHLADYRRVHPGIELRLTVGNTAQVAAAVHEGTVELGLVEGAVTDPALLSEVVARDQLVLVVAADHPWAGRARAELAELADIEWVLREPGSGTRSVFEAELARAGMMFTLRVALELPSNEAVRAAVEAGAGATVISASVVAPSLEAGLLHRVQLDLPDRAFVALRHRERHTSQAAAALLNAMKRGAAASCH
jgi:DNA-binding transcriptional LysR family regulator